MEELVQGHDWFRKSAKYIERGLNLLMELLCYDGSHTVLNQNQNIFEVDY